VDERKVIHPIKPGPGIAQADPERQKAHKKTLRADGKCRGRSLGYGRSTFPAARLVLSHAGATGSKDPVLPHYDGLLPGMRLC
jgi:hypothetical protein